MATLQERLAALRAKTSDTIREKAESGAWTVEGSKARAIGSRGFKRAAELIQARNEALSELGNLMPDARLARELEIWADWRQAMDEERGRIAQEAEALVGAHPVRTPADPRHEWVVEGSGLWSRFQFSLPGDTKQAMTEIAERAASGSARDQYLEREVVRPFVRRIQERTPGYWKEELEEISDLADIAETLVELELDGTVHRVVSEFADEVVSQWDLVRETAEQDHDWPQNDHGVIRDAVPLLVPAEDGE